METPPQLNVDAWVDQYADPLFFFAKARVKDREIEGLDTAEICNHMNITDSNCRVILYRARMLLRKCLEGIGYNNKNGGKP